MLPLPALNRSTPRSRPMAYPNGTAPTRYARTSGTEAASVGGMAGRGFGADPAVISGAEVGEALALGVLRVLEVTLTPSPAARRLAAASPLGGGEAGATGLFVTAVGSSNVERSSAALASPPPRGRGR